MAHLHTHSQYSVIDGRGLIQDYLQLAWDDGQKALAITDHGSIGGAIELYTGAKKFHDDTGRTIKPIIGCELYVDAFELGSKANGNQFGYGHFTVLAKNEAGYRALITANNLAHKQFYQKPRLTLQQILDGNLCENWIVLSGCMSSPIHNTSFADAENIVKQLAAKSANFFLEVMYHDGNEQFQAKQAMYFERISLLRKATGLPVVITNDSHFSYPHLEKLHISQMKIATTKSELEFDGAGYYFQTSTYMDQMARDIGAPDAWANAVAIGDMCDIVIPEAAEKINWHVPDITGGHPEAYLDSQCRTELYTMLQHGYGQEYEDRYNYEISVLRTSPAILNSYLVAHDVVSWCSDNGIPIAARGSMAGSLVSYLLGITREDPIKYGLSFSRAVNPARPTIPDFDLDVSSHRRPEVLNYLKERYAGNIPIVAYQHYGPRGALRKILNMEGLRDFPSVNELSKQLPNDWPPEKLEWNSDAGHYVYPEETAKLIEEGNKVQAFISPTQKETFYYIPDWLSVVPEYLRDYVMTYQGLYANVSVHPSGVLISGKERPIEREIPYQWVNSSSTLTSAYDMYSIKKMGLFKLDILGLKTLDQLTYMARVSGAMVEDDNYDDANVLMAFSADLLAEIFQMDGYACREVIRSIKGIKTFDDITAANTLARPGCAQFTQYYRSGFENLLREYPSLQEVLGPTNGLILYQEQVMEIARVLADFDDAEQDDIKESIKYFRRDHWDKTIAVLFRARCEAKGVDPTHILEAVAKMASYTFNKAHAMTYAALAYKMMWYKVYHPAVYYSAVFDDAEDKARLVLESHCFGVKWHPADVNYSDVSTTVKDGEIWLGLGSIKGVGPAAYEALSRARPFSSLDDLMERVERRKCNVRVIDILKKSFACASLGAMGTYTSFEEAFGFSYKYLDSATSKALVEWQMEQYGRVGGFITRLNPITVKKQGPNQGKEMAQITIMNIKGATKVVCFPDVWKKVMGTMYKGAAVKATGEFQTTGDFILAGVEEA